MNSQDAPKRIDALIDGIDALLADAPSSFKSAASLPAVDAADLPQKFLLAGIGDVKIAFPMECIGEIGTTPAITLLPNLPAWIRGIVNIRGEIITVVDLGEFLGVESLAIQGGDRFVVLVHGTIKVVVLIDRILGTVDRSAAEQVPDLSLATSKEGLAVFIGKGFAVDDQPVCILDVRLLLTSRRFLDYQHTETGAKDTPDV